MARNDRKAPKPGPRPDPRDLYLRWGIDTKFAYMFQQKGSVGLLIEWESPESAARARHFIPAKAHVAKVYLEPRGEEELVPTFWAMTIPIGSLKQFLRTVKRLATTIELAAPVSGGAFAVIENLAPVISESHTLMAVLDDGCAFANDRFRTPTGTRIVWLWNQDINAKGGHLNGLWPTTNVNFGYGAQWSNADLDSIYAAADGVQDEAYRLAGLPGLRRSVAHGTHVLDLLAGMDPSEDDPWDIVFVQFPQEGIDDPSGLWLKHFAADGLFYITECAGKDTKTIVANISWGPQTGPHDGKYVLENYIEWLIKDQWINHGRTLIVTLAAGNSFSARAHAQVNYRTGGSFEWILPPDGEIPAFIELWWPKLVTPLDAHFRVVPPSGPAFNVTAGPPATSPPDKTWWADITQVGEWATAMLVVNPTGGTLGSNGPHGRWRIEIDGTAGGVVGDIDVYVARADHNMGARRKAKASYLTDDDLEKQRFVAPSHRYEEAQDSAIRRHGTLSGIATAPSAYVAAGYVLKTGEPAPYSSSGPTRDGRLGVDYALMTDRSEARPGVRAAGVRTGTKARLVGTSTAAPQLGRLLAGATKPVPDPNDPERTGYGELEPPGSLIGPE
jgi:hypothetical protein